MALVLLERSWWAGFNRIYLLRLGFKMREILIFNWLLPNSNKFQKTKFWKEKSVEDVVTLGPMAQATLVRCKLAQSPMKKKLTSFRIPICVLSPKSKDFSNKLECTWFFDQIVSSVCLKLSRIVWRTFDALPIWLIYFAKLSFGFHFANLPSPHPHH